MDSPIIGTLIIILLLAVAVLCAVILIRLRNMDKGKEDPEAAMERAEILSSLESISRIEQRQELLRQQLRDQYDDLRKETRGSREETQRSLTHSFTGLRTELERKLSGQAMQNEQKLDNIRNTVEKRITAMQDDNAKQLDRMRGTVDEKLQKTLDTRIGESFKLVNQRLEQVYRGLGEMQNLANGVGDLKKVLTNVKTRGTLGEIQLEAILEQILTPEQYVKQASLNPNSNEKVDFAVKMPGEDSSPVYLPIDAKFPSDCYARLMDAYESGGPDEILAAGKELERTVRRSAKSIMEKYVCPPVTTDFAILFLPIEGLYAEVVRRGLVESLQRDYKINIAGPTTTAALLNSLQMGFRTLAIQKRSGEVWNVLGAVKTEFDKFETVLLSAQKRLDQANNDLDKLVGTRTKMMKSKLKKVSSLSESDAEYILPSGEIEDEDL